MGKPSSYTDEIAAEICDRLSTGECLTWICDDEHMPSRRTVSNWRKAHPQFDVDFMESVRDGHDAIAANLWKIANTPLVGITEKLEKVPVKDPNDPNGPGTFELQVTEVRREDMLGHRKLQIETGLKLLSKWDSGRFGDRVAIDHGIQDGLADKLKAARERAGIR